MKITPCLFEAFLKCPTKCHLRSIGEPGSGNEYADWVRTREESYECEAARRLQETVSDTEGVVTSPAAESLKGATWRLSMSVTTTAPHRSADSHVRVNRSDDSETRGLSSPRSELALESRLHAIERVPSEGRGRAAQFIPIRFISRNKLTRDDRLLLAFDAFVLSGLLGRDIPFGKIIHGDDHATLKVKLGARTAESARTRAKSTGLTDEVRKQTEKIAALLFGEPNARSADSHVRESEAGDGTRGLGGPRSGAVPDLVLNRHCAECEFRDRCRQKAIETDDLSLLAGMSAKERQKLRSKGIFTVTQLSYTFRPRRRPKRLRDKREKYHHSLKALAIREKKIHIVGSPELKIEGTPVYLDVEGLPDRDFYYLIGLRIGTGDSAVQHSLWADTVADEAKIWREFLAILETVEKPVLIHYGSYETTFLKRMAEHFGQPVENSVAASAIKSPVNVVSAIFAQTYFPTFRNGLKDIASFLRFTWGEKAPSGINTIIWRHQWETCRDSAARERLINYNSEDCRALEIIAQALSRNGKSDQSVKNGDHRENTVSVESLKVLETMWPKFKSPIGELEEINKAARWDYQRERIYVRSSRCIRRIAKRHQNTKGHASRVTKVIRVPEISCCPVCTKKDLRPLENSRRTLHDIKIRKGYLRACLKKREETTLTLLYFWKQFRTSCGCAIHQT